MQMEYSMNPKPNPNDPTQRPRRHIIKQGLSTDKVSVQLFIINENDSNTTMVLDTLMSKLAYDALEMDTKAKFQKAIIEAADKLFEAKPL